MWRVIAFVATSENDGPHMMLLITDSQAAATTQTTLGASEREEAVRATYEKSLGMHSKKYFVASKKDMLF